MTQSSHLAWHHVACAVLALSVPLAGSRAAGALAPRLETVEIAAATADVAIDAATTSTVERGRRFGVVGRDAGRVRVRLFDGKAIRLGWVEGRHVRLLGDGDVDLATAALEMAGRLNPRADLAACRRQLDALVGRLAEAAGREGGARARMRRVGRRLFGVEGFSYRKGVKRLDRVMAQRRGDCVGLSFIYLALARRLDLPLHLVTWPSHVLVRYDNGRDRFNIETTEKGEIRNVDDPVQHRRGRVAGGIHCRPLPHARALGVLCHVWGAILSGRGKHAEACERFARAVEINPRDAEAHALWGAALYKLGDHAAACSRYADTVAIDPQHGEVNIRWALALNRMGRYAEAAAKSARAVELAPEFADAWHNWGVALTKLDRHAEACERFAKAVELHPPFASAYAAWGAALTRLGRCDEADRKYRKAVLHAPRSAGAYAGWGYTLGQLGRHAEACEKYAEAVKLEPRNARVWNNLGWALARQGKYAEACKKCARSVELDPDRPASQHSYGIALAGLGRLDEACARFARAIELDPKHALSYVDWGATLTRMGKGAEATAKLDRAVELDPSLKAKVEEARPRANRKSQMPNFKQAPSTRSQ